MNNQDFQKAIVEFYEKNSKAIWSVVATLVFAVMVGYAYQVQERHSQIVAERAKQITVGYQNGIPVLYNAEETASTDEIREAITTWAIENGYDSVVIGRIQPGFSGQYTFATTDGKNQVPLTNIMQKLKTIGSVKAASFMSNRSNFWLPAPFAFQIDGELKVEREEGMQLAGFGIIKPKTILTADNFEAVIKDKYLDESK